LIPELQRQCGGSIVEQLFRLSHLAQEFYGLVCRSAEKVWPELAECSGDDSLKLDLKIFLTQPEPVKVELVRRGLAAVGSGERDVTYGHYERILQLAEKNISNRKITLPSGFVVWREYGNLIFTRVETLKSGEHIGKDVRLEMPGKTEFGNYLIESTFLEARECDVKKFKAKKDESVEWFDLDKLRLPLLVRFRRAGDRFWPLGLAGEKRIGKFLTAGKVPQEIRRKLLIIADSEKVIWVWPIRMSEQAKIAGRTRKVLQLQINEEKKA
jgi:tRNA(Ile)-lysidine synthase